MNEFSTGRQIITDVLRTGDLSPYLDRGWDLGWISDPANILRLAVFPDPHGAAWQFIVRHWEKHRKVPGTDLFKFEFPLYELSETGHAAPELLELASSAIQSVAAQDALGDLMAYQEAGDWESLATRAEDLARKVRGAGNGNSLDPAARPFRMLSLDDLEGLPDPEPLIEGILDRGTVSLLAGASGSAKSFLALDWALSVASGRAWFDREVRQGRVLYLAAEGAYGMKQRVRAWSSAHGRVPAVNFTLIPDAVQLADTVSRMYLVDAVKDFDLVIIDTLARTADGLDENAARDMGQYVNALYALRDAAREGGTTVVAVHHTGYDTKRARGSTAVKAGVDNVLMVEAKPDPHELFQMRFDKRKDGPAHTGNVMMQLVPEAESCVVVKLEDPQGSQQGARKTNKERVHAAVQDGCDTQDDIADATGINKGTVSSSLKALIAEGKVTSDGTRPVRYAVA